MILVAVGSKNPVKCNAAEQGLRSALDSSLVKVEGFEVPSGVSSQPFGDEETKLGAENRARSSFLMFNEKNGAPPTYSIGIEGGIIINDKGTANEEMHCTAWIVIFDGTRFGSAKTASFCLPPQICSLIHDGIELGAADDIVFSRVNSKQGDGTVGRLTRGVIDRTSYYSSAVILAMIPLQWPSLWSA
jgi:inosine/xanthosine triphosphatase